MQTPDGFRSLASTLLGNREPSPPIRQAQDDEARAQDDEARARDDEWAPAHDLDVLREARLFYARVIEAAEGAVETLLEDIAAEVLARELLLAPVEIEVVVGRALQRFASEGPLRVRVHAEDVSRVSCGIPVVADADLRPGDAIVELRSGSIDASLGARLAVLLQAVP